MKLQSKILTSFFIVICILVFTGGINLLFFLKINHSIDELVETRFVIEKKVQSGHLIVNKIYNKIWDTMLLDVDERSQKIDELDKLAISFYRIMDSLSDYLPYSSGDIRDQKRFFQTYYIVGKDILKLNDLVSLQKSGEKIDRFKYYKTRLTDQIDKRFKGYKNEFEKSLSDLQKDIYLIAAFSIMSVIFGAMVASIFSIKLSSSLVRPILNLTATIRKFTTGGKNIKAYENSDDEIGRLGASFNEMTRQLNESFEKLQAQIIERKQAEKKALCRRKQLVQADKMASLGILVSGVAHEINNPNQFILSHIEPLEKAWEGATPVLESYYEQYGDFRMGGTNYSLIKEKIPRIFSNIVEGSRRIKAIVDELRDFVNEKPQDYNARININDMVNSALTLISNMIKNSTDDFSFIEEVDIPLVPGHYQRLEQVIVNLLQNSCQSLTSRKNAIHIYTKYDKDDSSVLIKIRDRGKGIPMEDLEHITDPFFTTKREQGGTGLGLSISSRIIADHKGSMVFESQKNEGTSVVIRLPLNPERE